MSINQLFIDAKYQYAHWVNRRAFRRLRKGDGQYTLEGYDRLECIFVHIPKAGGISVSTALFGNLGGGHRTVRDYKSIFGPITYRRYYSFCFVRNPFSRLVSAYTFLKAGGLNKQDREWAETHLAHCDTFRDFVMDWLTEENVWSWIHFVPQHHFVCDSSSEPSVDFVGRFERLAIDFGSVCNRLGVDRKLPHRNSTSRPKRCCEYYSAEMVDRVVDVYRKDFEIFGYGVEPL